MPNNRVPAWRWEPNGILILAAMPVVGLATGFLGAQLALRPVHDALATRPPMLIVDLGAALQGLSPQAASAAIERHKEAAARLAGGGMLVLDAQAVLAAPADAFLKLPPDNE
jgi:hypothetical protein